ncbi:hypothetical protein ACJBU6_06524 [Exserohilum turcicum]
MSRMMTVDHQWAAKGTVKYHYRSFNNKQMNNPPPDMHGTCGLCNEPSQATKAAPYIDTVHHTTCPPLCCTRLSVPTRICHSSRQKKKGKEKYRQQEPGIGQKPLY